jgi:hypothetical protein
MKRGRVRSDPESTKGTMPANDTRRRRGAVDPVFGPIPARAFGDTRFRDHPTFLQLLGFIAAFDRLGRNGRGCFASNELLAVKLQCHYTSVSRALGMLRDWGYVTSEKDPANRRRWVHRIAYTGEDLRTLKRDDYARLLFPE